MNHSLCCPLHDVSKQVDFGIRSGFKLKRCDVCGLVYLSELPEGVEHQFYEDTADDTDTIQNKDAIEYWSFPSYYEKHQTVFDGFFEARLNRVRKAKPDLKSLLDVGCGYGFFLDYAQSRLPHVHGVELDPDVAKAAQLKGLPVECRSAESLLGEKSYDCVVMCDVLEHLKDPLDVLRLCHDLLNPGGVLYVQVPNLLGFKLPYGHSWGLPHHLWQFAPQSLQEQLEIVGFQNISHETGVLGVIGVLEHGGPSLLKRLEWLGARWFNCGNRLQTMAIRPE